MQENIFERALAKEAFIDERVSAVVSIHERQRGHVTKITNKEDKHDIIKIKHLTENQVIPSLSRCRSVALAFPSWVTAAEE